MLNRLLHGFLFGIGFAIAVAIIWTVHTLFVLPSIVTATFDESPPKSIDGEPAEVVPADVEPATSEREFELYKGSRTRMEIPSGGGVLSFAITDAPQGSERPSTIQVWITTDEAFLIETTGETPTVKNVAYPTTNAVDFASELVREYAGFRKGNSTSTVDAADIRAIRNGDPTRHSQWNGVLRITTEGVVFFVPNKFET